MPTVDMLLNQLEFPSKIDVQDYMSIVDFIGGRKRSGIYVLHLADNTYYVGLSKDVTERFKQHRLRFSDIVALSFKYIRQDDELLREEEKRVIHQLDAEKVRLHNKIHNTIAYSSSPFDILMTPEEQRIWLINGIEDNEERKENRPSIKPEKLVRDQRKVYDFQQLTNRRQISEALKIYITRTIPAYFRTEGRYWAMSCLPSTLGGWRAATISMSYMETFVVFRDGASFINVASTLFDEHFSSDDEFLETHPGTSIEVVGYEAAGFNQINITAESSQATMAMLNNPIVQGSARLMNLSLMRQRATLYSAHHSPGLTSLILNVK